MQAHFSRSRCRRFRRAGHALRDLNSPNPAGSINPNTQGVLYQYDQNGNLLFEQLSSGGSTGFLENSPNTHYYWLPTPQGDILVGFDQGINSYAVYTDHLGTPRLVTKIDNPQNPKPITDTSNDLPLADYGQPEGISPQAIPVWQWSYSPFGADLANGYEAQPTSIQDNFKPGLWAWVGLPETGGADQNQVAQETWRVQANLQIPPVLNIRYPGQYYDFESGLVQNWWRTYEPKIGRYTSADPIGLNGGWNRFAYVEGDGINLSDRMGLNPAVLTVCGMWPVGTGLCGATALTAGWAAWKAGKTFADFYSGKCPLGMCAEETNRGDGLPPEGILPPVENPEGCSIGNASRPKEQNRGGKSVWDEKGGEWRWSPSDKWHNEHWDYNPHNRPSSPWQNIPHGNIPVQK